MLPRQGRLYLGPPLDDLFSTFMAACFAVTFLKVRHYAASDFNDNG
jgi:hypothetical protein